MMHRCRRAPDAIRTPGIRMHSFTSAPASMRTSGPTIDRPTTAPDTMAPAQSRLLSTLAAAPLEP
jgi:hypothetical protein